MCIFRFMRVVRSWFYNANSIEKNKCVVLRRTSVNCKDLECIAVICQYEWQQWWLQEQRPSWWVCRTQISLFYCHPKNLMWHKSIWIPLVEKKGYTARCPQGELRYCMLRGQIVCFSFASFKHHGKSRAKIVQLQLGHVQDFADTQNRLTKSLCGC